MSKHDTHFGYETLPVEKKEKKVAEVFHSVAENYDKMNDLMSFGMHRLWKRATLEIAAAKPGQTVLDLAGGSGDLTRLFAKKVGDKGRVVLADINDSMLKLGKDRLLDEGLFENLSFVLANAESLPFAEDSFDLVLMSFGLRNVTHKEKALEALFHVCKPGGKLMILEFSTPLWPLVKPIYDWYSFNILPKMGSFFAKDEKSYQYLVESIRMHPNQEDLAAMIEAAGFEDCKYYNMSAGIVALHLAYKY